MLNLPPHARAALALALCPLFWFSSHVHALDPVVAEHGNKVEASNDSIATSGNNQIGVIARTGGEALLSNIGIATSGNGSMGVLAQGPGSRVQSSQALVIATSGAGSHGVLATDNAAIELDLVSASTTGDSTHGLLVAADASLTVNNVSISTQGVGSYGIGALSGGQLQADAVNITTEGRLAAGVHVNARATASIAGGQITTHGDNARGLYVLGEDASATAGHLRITTHGNAAAGVLVGASGAPTVLHNLQVQTLGTGASGIHVDQGEVHINDSLVRTEQAASRAIELHNASLIATDSTFHAQLGDAIRVSGDDNRLVLDASRVTAQNAAVVSVQANAQADIEIANQSLLFAENGPLFVLATGSRANVTVDDSGLNGNIAVQEGATLDLALRNNAYLYGTTNNVSRLSLASGATWDMDGDSNVGELHLDGGLVSFGSPMQFYTLAADSLTGSGIFALSLDMSGRQIDFLDIAGRAEGDHLLRIQNSGSEPVADFDPLHVIRTGGGDAHFALLGSRVDLGAFSYELGREGDDWYLLSERGAVSPSTGMAQALFNTAPTIWYGEMSTLRSRMGEVRGSGQGGSWMRAYGNQYNVDSGNGHGYRQRQMGLSLGVDAPVSVAEGQLLVGVLAGYSHSDLNLARGSKGGVESYYLGAYGTWLQEAGYYADGVLKLNQFNSSADVVMSDGNRAQGRSTRYGLGASLEVGRHLMLGNGLFVEPFTQFSGLVVGRSRLELDNGLNAHSRSTQSWLAKAGTTLGRTHVLPGNAIVQPYIKAAVAQEFARRNDVKVNGHRLRNDLHGTRGELGAGLAVSMSANLQLHGHVDYMHGQKIEQPYGVNVGLRYAFD